MSLTTLYLDLNSYFASVEQQERPELRGRPVGVVPFMAETTCCLAASIQAKRAGVKTGTLVRDARRMCPSIVFVESRARLYVQYHHEVIKAIERHIPVRGVHSIDEVSCRLQPSERNERAARALALAIKASIREHVGDAMRCSIGIAPNRFLAKVGTDMQKPDGLVVLDTPELPQRLFGLSLRDLPGIGRRMEERLDRKGIRTVEDLCALDARAMEEAWESVVGRAWWHWLRGDDLPEPRTRRRSVGHQHVLSPENRTDERARAILVRLLTKAAARLRHIGYGATKLCVWLRYMDPERGRAKGGEGRAEVRKRTKWSEDLTLPAGCADTMTMLEALGVLWEKRPRDGRTPLCVGVTLHDLSPREEVAGALFEGEKRRLALARAVDRLDAKYGRHTVYPASMHDARASATGGIAFQNVPDLSLPDTLDEEEEEDRSD